MTKLEEQENDNYYVNNKKDFTPQFYFNEETLQKVFEFSYSMTFGKEGEHRDHRSGGNLRRKKGEIFINTFQGKLSEMGIYNSIYQSNKAAYDKLSKPDFEVYGLGEWDDTDIILEDIKFSVKSTSSKGNLLLLETKDWNENGEYIPNLTNGKNAAYDYHILVRVNPDGKKIMSSNRLLYSNDIDKNKLWDLIKSQKWEYDIPGYITKEDLQYVITNKFIINQGDTLNRYTKMDAANYYIQCGDMKKFEDLVSGL